MVNQRARVDKRHFGLRCSEKSTIPYFVWLVLTPLRQYAIFTRGDQKVRGKVLLNHIVLSIAMKEIEKQ